MATLSTSTERRKSFRQVARESERDFDAHTVAAYAPYYVGVVVGYSYKYFHWNSLFSECGGEEDSCDLEGDEGILALCFMAAMVEAGDA